MQKLGPIGVNFKFYFYYIICNYLVLQSNKTLIRLGLILLAYLVNFIGLIVGLALFIHSSTLFYQTHCFTKHQAEDINFRICLFRRPTLSFNESNNIMFLSGNALLSITKDTISYRFN